MSQQNVEMSQENVELAHRYADALNERTVPVGLLAADFVMVNASTAVSDKTYHGADGVIEWTSELFEAFDPPPQFEIRRVVADGADFVVATVRLHGTAARSGAPLDMRWAAVFWCRDGRISRVVGYLTREEALRAVGLETS